MGVLSLNSKVTILGLGHKSLGYALEFLSKVWTSLMQSQRWMLMLMSVILSAVEVRHNERVVEGEAQEFCPLRVVERPSQGVDEAGSAAHHASYVSAGEEVGREACGERV